MNEHEINEKVVVKKEKVLASVGNMTESALGRYRRFFVGDTSIWYFLLYEFASLLAMPVPGAVGYVMRKFLYRRLGSNIDRSVLWGCNVALRHPSKILVGAGTAFDDYCMLDARGAEENGLSVGRDVLIARETVLQAKTGFLHIGSGCVIGPKCYIGSAGGIQIGNRVMIGGCSYIGGGRYEPDGPLSVAEQEAYTNGPVVIEDDVYIGAGAYILDGVHVGRGAFIGAGAIVQNDVAAKVILAPHQKQVSLPRRGAVNSED